MFLATCAASYEPDEVIGFNKTLEGAKAKCASHANELAGQEVELEWTGDEGYSTATLDRSLMKRGGSTTYYSIQSREVGE